MIFNSSKTIYTAKITLSSLLNQPYRPELNTTLNEKLDCYPNHEITNPPYPVLNVITFGYSGVDMLDSNLMDLKRAKHTALDGALFKHAPFLVVPSGTVLTEDEKNKYRLKSKLEVLGIVYDAYYGIVIDRISYDDRIFKVKINEGTSIMSPIDTKEDASILSPIVKNNDNITEFTNDYILNSAMIKIQLDATEVEKLVKNIKLIEGNENDIVISEIGLCTSIEEVIDDHKESMWTQIAYFVDVSLDIQLKHPNDTYNDLEYIIDIGGMEPLSLPS